MMGTKAEFRYGSRRIKMYPISEVDIMLLKQAEHAATISYVLAAVAITLGLSIEFLYGFVNTIAQCSISGLLIIIGLIAFAFATCYTGEFYRHWNIITDVKFLEEDNAEDKRD